jgi:hypothetical protein
MAMVMKPSEFITNAIDRGQRDGVAALDLLQRAVFLTSELEVLVDMEGIDSFVSAYSVLDIRLAADLLSEAGAHEIAKGLSLIARTLPSLDQVLMSRINQLVSKRHGYDSDALERVVARRMASYQRSMEPPGALVTNALGELGAKPEALPAFDIVWRFVRDSPRQLAPLLQGMMSQAPAGGTFFDAALSHVSEQELTELVDAAVGLLETNPEHEAAAACVVYASLQAVDALRPHLRKLFELRPSRDTYYAPWAWRRATDLEVAFLQRVVVDKRRPLEDRNFAWSCLAQTRSEQVLSWLLRNRPPRPSLPADLLAAFPVSSKKNDRASPPIDPELAVVGFTVELDVPRSLWAIACFHLRFADQYMADFRDPPWRQKLKEPTWTLPCEGTSRARLGGLSEGLCTSCGGALCVMLDLATVPSELGVTTVERLRLQACLSCLGWERPEMQFAHHVDGSVVMLGEHERVTPQFPAGPLREVEVHLCSTPARWQRQDWGLSNSRENLNRLGGEPSWIQSPAYPTCSVCQRAMPFLAQLDSYLHADEGGEWMWGSGGIGYFFWCDPCRVSCVLWQCT